MSLHGQHRMRFAIGVRAKDYVRMQWMMLQQDVPEDFVIATGVQYSVREFIRWSAAELGLTLRFEGTGVRSAGHRGDLLLATRHLR